MGVWDQFLVLVKTSIWIILIIVNVAILVRLKPIIRDSEMVTIVSSAIITKIIIIIIQSFILKLREYEGERLIRRLMHSHTNNHVNSNTI
jgi:hypothetical protein